MTFLRLGYIVLGIILLAFGYAIYSIAFPWIEWKDGLFPTLEWTYKRPLWLPALIFMVVGSVSFVCGITEEFMLRFFISFFVITAIILFLTGTIPLYVGEI